MIDGDMSVLINWVFPFVVGAVFGSFLNVCIYRIPQGLSLVSPPSHCPQCKERIRPYDNIPILSYLLLKGRCRQCKNRISIRYPIVELVAGVLTPALVDFYGLNLVSLSYIILTYVLIVVALIDLDHLIVPNGVILFGFGAGIVLLLVDGLPVGWKDALLGAAVVSGFLYLSGLLGIALFRKQSMGFGDVKLGAMIGLYVGWQWAVVLLFQAFFIAALIGSAGLVTNRIQFGQRIPFGPFLSLGTVSTLFLGDFIWESIIQQIILR